MSRARGEPEIAARPMERLFGLGTVVGLDESELLRRFVRNRDEAAFAALLSRHGPMVLGVCRRILGDGHAADDAFQAVFLILVKKAGAIRDGGRLGPWLHGVARRVALRSRSRTSRRLSRERSADEMADPTTSRASGHDPLAVGDDLERAELRTLIDAEIGRLPEKFRAPVVLCYLEGLTHDQAADRLGCPVGTVRSRMARARETLRGRLGRLGLTVPTSLVAASAGTSSGKAATLAIAPAVSPRLLDSTLRAALHVAAGHSWALGVGTGIVSGSASELARGVLGTMFIHKWKLAALLVGTLGLTGGLAVAMQFGGAGFPVSGRQPDNAPEAKHAILERRAERIEGEIEALEARKAKLEDQLKSVREALSQNRDSRDEEPSAKAPPTDLGQAGEVPGGKAPGIDGAFGLSSTNRTTSPTKGKDPGIDGDGFGDARRRGPAGMGAARFGRGGFGADGPGVGLGGGFGGMGRPGANASRTIMSSKIIAVNPRETDTIAAYSTETGQWASFTVPEGVTATPILSNDLMALHMEGDVISEIAVFDAQGGHWHPQKLEEPVSGRATPILSNTLVVYGLGRHVYAYSPEANRWGTLTLPEGADPATPIAHAAVVVVENEGKIHTFSAKTGRWTEFDTREK